MTSEYNRRPSRRATRSGRSRPELVTSTDEVKSEPTVLEANDSIEEGVVNQALTPEAQPAAPRRRLASFFSTVGRGEKTEAQENEVAQARLARATRGKAIAKDDAKSETGNEDKVPARATAPARTTPARPASLFKTKYLLGMVVYLFGAQFIGLYEQQFMAANHLNFEITRFSVFGGLVVISTSTLVFLATLLILLVVLARFDLIPRSLGALSGQQAQARKNASNRSNSSEVARTPQPTMRQGVKGADDDLYQEYRSNQRRAKKR